MLLTVGSILSDGSAVAIKCADLSPCIHCVDGEHIQYVFMGVAILSVTLPLVIPFSLSPLSLLSLSLLSLSSLSPLSLSLSLSLFLSPLPLSLAPSLPPSLYSILSVGGCVHSLAWDPSGERMAVSFTCKNLQCVTSFISC